MGDREIRVGDAEREDALRVLGEHLSAGRLDVDEYGERTARATAARNRGELLDLFSDLPHPHPALSAATAVRPMPPPPGLPARRGVNVAVAGPAVLVGFVLLAGLVKSPFVFLLIPVVLFLLVGRDRRR
ncbi:MULTISPECIES: DUF1707 SHOCT-like domain-containing protein [Actinosynnema]|uniref:DUF1707 domain-containing protein n=1 Tax=Actinosynnema pretiosum TaxID=42197 RepID=A0A290ZE54_9PSEU|nr:DUF1707 domain-containing protein [Actinosynnema pretiosum]ATE57249.1 hypothetical protein CNX65_31420 [Actinosynnema pretiosum]